MTIAPSISVVIPVYNNPSVAIRAVRSVMHQSTAAHEVILVDDASDPKATVRVMRWVARCSSSVPIRVERLSANRGPGMARHRGAALATGTHVAFLDADDLWHRRKIQQVMLAISDCGAALLGHQRPWAFILPDGALTDLPDTVTRRQLTYSDFLRRNPIPTSSLVARTDIARKMFRLGGRKSEDYMALVIAARLAGSALFVEASLCWAKKPPFGHSGQGADQFAIYIASAENMLRLRRIGVISSRDFAVFLSWLVLRIPIGIVRLWQYRWAIGARKERAR